MSSGDGLDLLKPFLPGLEAALDDPDVSEIMINGPGNVWLEGHGRLRPIDAPALDAAALERAAIHIARPLGLDPATTPVLDARLDDGSRVAICVPPASPHVTITVRRFGKRAFTAAQLVEQGALPVTIRDAARRTLHTRSRHPKQSPARSFLAGQSLPESGRRKYGHGECLRELQDVGVAGHQRISTPGKRELQKWPVGMVAALGDRRRGLRHGDGLAEGKIVVEEILPLPAAQREFRIGENADQLGRGLLANERPDAAGAPGAA